MREEPKPLQVYKHFKGDYYQIITVASHSETGEKLVIYRPLFDDDHVCARPLEMFLSDVDHDKYPKVKQKYRFALVTGHSRNAHTEKGDGSASENEKQGETEEKIAPEDDKDTENVKDMDKTVEDTLLDEFLDAKSSEEKLDILTGRWKTITEENIDNIAVVLDMELNGKTLEEKYKDNPDKLAKLKTVKAGCAFALAALLCAFFLACIYKDDALPKIGGIAVTPIWFAAMFILQMLCDLKGLKTILGKIFGRIVETPKVKEEAKPKKKKKKYKKEVKWIAIDEDEEE